LLCVLIWYMITMSTQDLSITFLETWEKYSRDLETKNSDILLLNIIWFGRNVFKDGVSFDPVYSRGLTELSRLDKAKHLEYFLAQSIGLE
jgi:hypothetical protein